MKKTLFRTTSIVVETLVETPEIGEINWAQLEDSKHKVGIYGQ